MSPVSLVPQQVPAAVVRRIDAGVPEGAVPVQHVEVARVVAPSVVPRQPGPVALRAEDAERLPSA